MVSDLADEVTDARIVATIDHDDDVHGVLIPPGDCADVQLPESFQQKLDQPVVPAFASRCSIPMVPCVPVVSNCVSLVPPVPPACSTAMP